MDYNYLVLQKRNDENVTINNQQKRRVAKLNLVNLALKKKVVALKSSSDTSLNRITNDIKKLHSSINDLEKKALSFRLSNKRKFDKLWDINFKEIRELVEEFQNMDKILHEQLLSLEWNSNMPELVVKDLNKDYELPRKRRYQDILKAATKRKKELEVSSTEAQANEIRLLRNILRKISDRGGFLVESKLEKILEPYSEAEQCLVRIDNIFKALRVQNADVVTALTSYFEPYAYCPNCSEGLSPRGMNNFHLTRRKLQEKDKTIKLDPRNVRYNDECKNHYLVMDSTFILTSLNDFTSDYTSGIYGIANANENEPINLINVDNKEIIEYWGNFEIFIPEEREKLWQVLEHGLNHYYDSLRKRHTLDTECIFLRKQNAELKHLLQKFRI